MITPECPLCFHPYTNVGYDKSPRVLNCGHTFCHSCLHKTFVDPDKYPKKKKRRDCPVCKKDGVYTPVEQIPLNYALIDVIEQNDKLQARKVDAIDKLCTGLKEFLLTL